MDFLQAARTRQRPWFLYAAYNAAHFPLHAPKALIDKYTPVYEKGWDAIREARFAKLRELGLIDRRWRLPERSIIGPNRISTPKGTAGQQNPAWSTLPADRRADLARRMAIYAGMIDSMDRNIGRLVQDLERNRELDNTLIVFLSDNGACAEWDPYGFDGSSGPNNVLHRGEDLARMGQQGTYHSYGSAWATLAPRHGGCISTTHTKAASRHRSLPMARPLAERRSDPASARTCHRSAAHTGRRRGRGLSEQPRRPKHSSSRRHIAIAGHVGPPVAETRTALL